MQQVDAVIRERLTSRVALIDQIARYIVSAGGKRIRPRLVLLLSEALGFEGPERFELAAVVEFIHTATPVSYTHLGLNHTTAPLDLRGRLAFAPEQTAPALQGLRQRLQRSVPEAALVSTCNRTELYVAAGASDLQDLVRPTVDWLAEQGGISGSQLLDHSYVREDRAAARHAFRVAAGLDSICLLYTSRCV